MIDLNFLIGSKKSDVFKYMDDNKLNYRLVREDQNNYITTCDLNPERYNLEFDKNLLTKWYNG